MDAKSSLIYLASTGRHQGRGNGTDARMRWEKSGASSAACAASLIRERRRSSLKGSVVSRKPML